MPQPTPHHQNQKGSFDIIGDVHGCYDELVDLLAKLGYEVNGSGVYKHPEGRRAIFVGDLCDRGPKNILVLKLVMQMVKQGSALCVPGNHDDKLRRYLKGRNVQQTHGLEKTVTEIEAESEAFRRSAAAFLENLPTHYILDGGKLVVAHAGLKESLQGQNSEHARLFSLYGDTTGKTDEHGLPIRRDWAAHYHGQALVVYGHTPFDEPVIKNNTYCIDTSCVFGGKLTALRYPERELISVKAKEAYAIRAYGGPVTRG
ncbi:MAG: hypothetical protein GX768_10815 [Chloroflexi bacterium]|nr:hypothetical protein [Chloroflexota bacterium]